MRPLWCLVVAFTAAFGANLLIEAQLQPPLPGESSPRPGELVRAIDLLSRTLGTPLPPDSK